MVSTVNYFNIGIGLRIKIAHSLALLPASQNHELETASYIEASNYDLLLLNLRVTKNESNFEFKNTYFKKNLQTAASKMSINPCHASGHFLMYLGGTESAIKKHTSKRIFKVC